MDGHLATGVFLALPFGAFLKQADGFGIQAGGKRVLYFDIRGFAFSVDIKRKRYRATKGLCIEFFTG